MLWSEFEKIAGYEVSVDDYNNIIEPMYMALPNVSKEDFVKMIDKKRFALPTPAELLREIRKEARHLYDICGHCSDFKSEQRMEAAAHKYLARKYGLDWSKDIEAFAYFLNEYEYPELKRGCTYPVTLVVGRGNTEYERISLQKKH
jgi:hypothetical protein